MATKVIVLGQEEKKQTKKPIEFVRYLKEDYKLSADAESSVSPSEYSYIELICKDYTEGIDLMFAYYKNRAGGTLYVGHFNDGVVE